MKKLLVFVFLLAAAVVVSAQDDFELNVTDSAQVVLRGDESPMCLIVRYSDLYIDSLIRDCGADETELENLYTGLDDYAWYMHLCSMALDSLGWSYRVVASDVDIFVVDEGRHYAVPSRDFVGVVVYKKEEPLEFVELMDFLSRVNYFGN